MAENVGSLFHGLHHRLARAIFDHAREFDLKAEHARARENATVGPKDSKTYLAVVRNVARSKSSTCACTKGSDLVTNAKAG